MIATSLERLLAVPGNFKVMVIDDASEDGTADVVRQFDPERVWLFQRTLPDARKGKGEALNAAYRHLCTSGVLGERNPDDVIVAVLDADGRLAPNALIEVAPFFADPAVGGVQIGVRMYNAKEKLLARMQDFEFVTFTEIFQRARQRIGSVGLGGNGQFNRLSALQVAGVGAVDQMPDRGSRSGHPVAHSGLAQLLLPDHPCQPAGGRPVPPAGASAVSLVPGQPAVLGGGSPRSSARTCPPRWSSTCCSSFWPRPSS